MVRTTYLEHVPLHLLRPLLVLKPALRPEVVRILAEHLLVTMQHPPVGRNRGAAGEETAVQLGALGRDKTGDVEADSGTHAHGLLEAGLQVEKGLRLVPGEVARGGDGARLDGGLELADDGLVDGLGVEDVPEERLHRRGGRVGAGEAAQH